jgi:hypothetical protein
MSVIIGYARVSTEDQHLDAQTSALEAIGADRIFAEKISGTKKSRPELDRMIEQLRDGDVVVVTKYDRLSRSLQDLLSIVEAVGAKGAGFRSLAEDIDTTTPAGRLVFHSLPPSPSSSANGYPRGPKKDLPPPASGGALGADLPPYPQSAAQRLRVCATKKAVALQSWHVCSR